MTFVIPKDLLRRWSNYDAILKEYMYPPLSDDNGAQFWGKAEQRLRNAGLETNPENGLDSNLRWRYQMVIDELIQHFCPNGVRYAELDQVVTFTDGFLSVVAALLKRGLTKSLKLQIFLVEK